MMRYLLLAALCLLSTPAKADIVSVGDYVIEGACLDQCNFLTLRMGVGGTGPAFAWPTDTSPATGFTILSFLTVTNGQGDTGSLGADYNNIGDRYHSLSGIFVSPFATTPGDTLHVSLNTMIFSSPCCTVPNVSFDISLPSGLTATPAVPELSTWAMIIIGFIGVALYRKVTPRSNRRTTCENSY